MSIYDPPADQRATCPDCHGHGYDIDPDVAEYELTCDTCWGEGSVEKESLW